MQADVDFELVKLIVHHCLVYEQLVVLNALFFGEVDENGHLHLRIRFNETFQGFNSLLIYEAFQLVFVHQILRRAVEMQNQRLEPFKLFLAVL